MKELVEVITRALVDNPDSVVVNERTYTTTPFVLEVFALTFLVMFFVMLGGFAMQSVSLFMPNGERKTEKLL